MSQTARTVAVSALLRVWQDEAYAAAALSAALQSSQLDPRDRGLATELTYGVLRTEPYLERLISQFGKLKSGDLLMRGHLLVAAYQLCFLSKIPAHAAVDEAVTAVKKDRGPSGGGFANGLLRNLGRNLPSVELSEAVLSSTPSWLRKRLLRDVGEKNTFALLTPSATPRPTLRLCAGHAIPEWFADECEQVEGVEGAYLFLGGGDPRRKPEFEAGAFVVQELGAQIVARALGVQPGERVLDVCAGRGQKTFLLGEALSGSGSVLATDLFDHKISALLEQAEKSAQAALVHAETWDWTKEPKAQWQGSFDRVLVDAPCSGIGTLRRRPEILRRLTAQDPARMAELQLQIVDNAQKALKPGGVLLFATCSVLAEEGRDMVARITDTLPLTLSVPTTSVDAFLSRLAQAETGHDSQESTAQESTKRSGLPPVGSEANLPSSSLLLLPEPHRTDGYFIARFTKL